MNPEIIKIAPDSKDLPVFDRINTDAFPPYERMEISEMLALSESPWGELLGIYEEGKPIGLALIAKNSACGYIYYLAVSKEMRNKGYGSLALGKLRQMYSDIQLTLDFEELNENAENYPLRVSRKAFYLRNGFHETGRYTILNNERFEVVCTGGVLKEEALKDLIHILHKMRPGFLDELI